MSFMFMPMFHMSEDPDIPTPSGSVSSAEKESSPTTAPITTPEAYQLLPKNQFPDKCAVCRNPSIGYCYNVPSCSGCKTFFRRTIVDGKRFICLMGTDCLEETEPIDITKRMCRACRFAKCVDVGMDPTAIRTAIRTVEGNFLLEEVLRKQKRMSIENKHFSSSNENLLVKMIGKLTLLEDETDKLHLNGIPLEYEDHRTLSEVLAHPVPVFNLRRVPNLTPAAEKSTRQTCKTFMHTGVLAIIEYSKSFDYSSKLALDTRIKLIKHVALLGSIMASASFSMHSKRSDALVNPDGKPAGAILNCFPGMTWIAYTEQLEKTLHAFLGNRVDRVEYMLLKAIAISNPAIDGISRQDQEIIEAERNIYGRVLFDYCILQHGISHGPARLAALLSLISIVEMQSKAQKDFYIMMKATATDNKCKTPSRNSFDEVMDP